MPLMHHMLLDCGPRPAILLNIVADTADYNIFTAAGSPGAAVTIGGAKGAAGKAVALNCHVATWLAGNDSLHVKGNVA